jgi:hypothetical protein
LAAQVRVRDEQRGIEAKVALQSHLPLERQVRAIGATWLDRQLLGKTPAQGGAGFGAEVRDALRDRVDTLLSQGLAERHGSRVIFARNLLSNLRDRELAVAARVLTEQTGKTYRAAEDCARIQGIYRQNIQPDSGKFALLDQGIGVQSCAVETGTKRARESEPVCGCA